MTFQDAVAQLKVYKHGQIIAVNGWRYNTVNCHAYNSTLNKDFVGSWYEFLIEKKIIDIYNCDSSYPLD